MTKKKRAQRRARHQLKTGKPDRAALILADSQIKSVARCGAAAHVPWDHAMRPGKFLPIRVIAARALARNSATTGRDMVERVAVLLGTVQFRLKLKINLPKSATLADADNVARATLVDEPVRKWTLVDDLGGGPPVQLAVNDFIEVGLQSVETSVPDDEQPEVLLEKED